jgi:diphthine synthase
MFYIIGIGLQSKQITLQAIEAIKDCRQVYIDNYTNKLSEGEIEDLESIFNKKIKKLNRKELEIDCEYIKNKSALLVIGSPLLATTHYSVYLEAKKRNLDVKIINGISIFNYRSYSGLFEYKFGKTTTIVYLEKNYKPHSFYKTIIDNLKINAHTLCLLDIKINENRLMNIKEAGKILEDLDENKILENRDCIALCAMGSDYQKIISFKFKEYNKIDCKVYPQSLIICAKLNDFEKEALDEYRID